MKSTLLIFSIFLSLGVSAQSYSEKSSVSIGDESDDSYNSANHLSGFFPGILLDSDEPDYSAEADRISLFDFNSFTIPSPPLLTTSASDLEICTGNSTRLTASSNHEIHWYTTPPPIGSPVGTGTSYITPVLTTGYYTYYAVAENNGARSEITAMEVIMVYPNPNVNIISRKSKICAGESVTLTAIGTTYYEWEKGPVSEQIVVTPENTQVYQVTGINTAGCRSTAAYTQFVEVCSPGDDETYPGGKEGSARYSSGSDHGISGMSIKEDRLFSVFPNPNNGDFNILVNSISESTKIEIYNAIGELSFSSKVTGEITAVGLKESPNGIYIVRITENDKVLRQQKIVKE